MPGSCFWGIWFRWVLDFIEYRAYSINSPDDVIGHCTMNVEDWGHREFPSNSGNSLLLSLDWDMTKVMSMFTTIRARQTTGLLKHLAGMRHLISH